LKDFLNSLNSNVTFTLIDDILIVPVKISNILLLDNPPTIFAERYYNDDFDFVWDRKVKKSVNAYIFNVNVAKTVNENLMNGPNFSFENKYNKCSFYGEESSFGKDHLSFINDNRLGSFYRYYSNELDGKEALVESSGKNKFLWSTFCNGVIWMNSFTKSIYLGIKYKKPEVKVSEIDHYFIKTDQLFFQKKSDKIKRLINEATGVDSIIFNQNSILKEINSLDFMK